MSVVRAHADEEQVGSHVDVVVVVGGSHAAVGGGHVGVPEEVTVGDDVGVLGGGSDAGGEEGLGVHGVDARDDALEAVLLALRYHRLRLAGRGEVEVNSLQLLVIRVASGHGLDHNLVAGFYGLVEADGEHALVLVVVKRDRGQGGGVQFLHVGHEVWNLGVLSNGRRAKSRRLLGEHGNGQVLQVVGVEHKRGARLRLHVHVRLARSHLDSSVRSWKVKLEIVVQWSPRSPDEVSTAEAVNVRGAGGAGCLLARGTEDAHLRADSCGLATTVDVITSCVDVKGIKISNIPER